MVKGLPRGKKMYYYAFRYSAKMVAGEHEESLPVTAIMKDTNVWLTGWLDDKPEGHCYFSGITEDEYNMLDAFGIRITSVAEYKSQGFILDGVDITVKSC